jgi:hypothetical protein
MHVECDSVDVKLSNRLERVTNAASLIIQAES